MIERSRTGIVDVLDHVLDKGIVIDAWVNVALVGIELVTVEARVVVASIATYMKYSTVMSHLEPVSRQAQPERRFRVAPPPINPEARRPLREHSSQMMRRRAEDRVVDELHDARARTVRKFRKR
jgi:hypothetical protein